VRPVRAPPLPFAQHRPDALNRWAPLKSLRGPGFFSINSFSGAHGKSLLGRRDSRRGPADLARTQGQTLPPPSKVNRCLIITR